MEDMQLLLEKEKKIIGCNIYYLYERHECWLIYKIKYMGEPIKVHPFFMALSFVYEF